MRHPEPYTRMRGLLTCTRTCSARILCDVQISSLSLYMEMPEAHANPNAKLVTRVPNMGFEVEGVS